MRACCIGSVQTFEGLADSGPGAERGIDGREEHRLVKEPTLAEIVQIADRLFPFEHAETWDNCGIQIGQPNRLIHSIAFSLDVTLETVEFASRCSCGLLVTHHPLMMEPVRRISSDDFVGRIVLHAVRSAVDILSLHTNLDAAPGGLNDDVANRMGLQEVIVPHPARCARMGRLLEPVPVSVLGRSVAREFGIPLVRIISREDRLVSNVFSACGSGMGYWGEAVRYRADVVVTGDVRYHAAREAYDAGIPVIDAGHYGLEKGVVGLMARAFRSEADKLGLRVECVECDIEREPFTILM